VLFAPLCCCAPTVFCHVVVWSAARCRPPIVESYLLGEGVFLRGVEKHRWGGFKPTGAPQNLFGGFYGLKTPFPPGGGPLLAPPENPPPFFGGRPFFWGGGFLIIGGAPPKGCPLFPPFWGGFGKRGFLGF